MKIMKNITILMEFLTRCSGGMQFQIWRRYINIWSNSDSICFANKFVRSFRPPVKYPTNRYGICAMTKQPCTCDAIKYRMKEKEKREKERKDKRVAGHVLINVSVRGLQSAGDNTRMMYRTSRFWWKCKWTHIARISHLFCIEGENETEKRKKHRVRQRALRSAAVASNFVECARARALDRHLSRITRICILATIGRLAMPSTAH